MKKFLATLILVSGIIFLGISGAANATLYTDTDGPFIKKITVDNPYTWSVTMNGFDPLAEDITSASIGIALADDLVQGRFFWQWQRDPGAESAALKISSEYTEFAVVPDANGLFKFAIPDELVDKWLQPDGFTYFTVASTVGDFNLLGSLFCAETQPVPEPATMLLLGTGLLGLAGYGRRKFNK